LFILVNYGRGSEVGKAYVMEGKAKLSVTGAEVRMHSYLLAPSRAVHAHEFTYGFAI
jgi:hypothetical protein